MTNRLKPIIFGAPFGNWFGGRHVTRTLGTFTLKRRGGHLYRWWRVIKTVRYSPLLRAWTNRLGLPNPGIDSALAPGPARKRLPGTILSLHGFGPDDWMEILERFGNFMGEVHPGELPAALELNMSCPNVEHDPFGSFGHRRVFEAGLKLVEDLPEDARPLLIAKLPPVRWEMILDQALAAGMPGVHCCNTLPVKRGGMSGKPLKVINLAVVEKVRERTDDVRIIGGGGITGTSDILDYHRAGADHFAVASALFAPWHRWRFRAIGRMLADPEKALADLTGA